MEEQILEFWFGKLDGEIGVDKSKSPLWWQGRKEDDDAIKERFGSFVAKALAGELDDWTSEPHRCLALVILLDQFTRVVGRGTPEAFAGDAKAQGIVRAAIDAGVDQKLRLIERAFFYMPLMHAEDREAAELSVKTYQGLSEAITASGAEDFPDNLKHAVQHADIVRQFGRYPHRNEILGRTATPEEEAFLAGGGPTFGQKKK